jgi:hypothetical protein
MAQIVVSLIHLHYSSILNYLLVVDLVISCFVTTIVEVA